jgi:hypothetical protein
MRSKDGTTHFVYAADAMTNLTAMPVGIPGSAGNDGG